MASEGRQSRIRDDTMAPELPLHADLSCHCSLGDGDRGRVTNRDGEEVVCPFSSTGYLQDLGAL